MVAKEIAYGQLVFAMMLVLLIGFSLIVGLDSYMDRRRKTVYALVIVLVFTHIMQNFIEHWMMNYYPTPWRTLVAVYGYTVRPIILTLYAHLIAPKKKHVIAWIANVVNAGMHVTAFWTRLVFQINDNRWMGGPLRHWCLITSACLFTYLIFLIFYQFRRASMKEIVFHLFWTGLIVAGFVSDMFLDNRLDLWINFLSLSMICAIIFSYLWLHQKYVHEYQTNFIAEQRNRIILSQIQPHFIYNTLSSIRNIEGNPEETKHAITEFANFIRGNLAALDGRELIPFKKELEYVKDYVCLQQRRFPGRINVIYDINDDIFSLPPLTIQILVENAIKHGIVVRYEEGLITIRTHREKRYHVIEIIDNGVGFDTKILETTDRVGVRAVKNRLEYYLDGTVSYESTIGVGTHVTIKIPCDPIPKSMVLFEKKKESKK